MELKETQGNSRKLKETQENLGFFKEALVDVMEGKKLRKRGQRGKISQIRQEQEEKRKIDSSSPLQTSLSLT